MSKKSKKATKQKNMQAKRAKKDANRAMYQERARQGVNSKSKRSVKRGKGKNTSTKGKHEILNCGNPACSKCYPQYVVVKPAIANQIPEGTFVPNNTDQTHMISRKEAGEKHIHRWKSKNANFSFRKIKYFKGYFTVNGEVRTKTNTQLRAA